MAIWKQSSWARLEDFFIISFINFISLVFYQSLVWSSVSPKPHLDWRKGYPPLRSHWGVKACSRDRAQPKSATKTQTKNLKLKLNSKFET